MSESPVEPLHHRVFTDRTLRASRFIGCDLTAVVVRGSEVAGMEIDSPWLLEGGNRLVVNGVDVVPLVDAELDRRFPGRGLRAAEDPVGLQSAWDALEKTWSTSTERARSLPEGTVEASVADEWSFTQTLRHLVFATDTWLGRAVLRLEQPYHPLGLANDGGGSVAADGAVFAAEAPAFAEVLQARTSRQRMVREFLATTTPETLAEPRPNPHNPDDEETVLSCLRTILEEEWEHHRYAVRDLDSLAAKTH